MGLTDALAEPMGEVFDAARSDWNYDAVVPGVLRSTALPLPPATKARADCTRPTRSAAYWEAAMAGQDFSREDHLDTAAFNLALWKGLKGDAPYPAGRDGRDLSGDRSQLLADLSRHCD